MDLAQRLITLALHHSGDRGYANILPFSVLDPAFDDRCRALDVDNTDPHAKNVNTLMRVRTGHDGRS